MKIQMIDLYYHKKKRGNCLHNQGVVNLPQGVNLPSRNFVPCRETEYVRNKVP